ncbi:MAG: PDDEXK nuclease domain-containing protein [Planctomycetaceae bacterium]|nr:PDDEXK nuclease domain-containing protein [Planctomycetaceae bacterium]
MELYLKWLNQYEKQDGENLPIGLILCAESSREQVELLEMHKDGIIVAEYWTELPSKQELEQKIHEILIEVRERLERNKLLSISKNLNFNRRDFILKIFCNDLWQLLKTPPSRSANF